MGSGEDCGPRSALGLVPTNSMRRTQTKPSLLQLTSVRECSVRWLDLLSESQTILFILACFKVGGRRRVARKDQSGDCHRRRLRNSYEINAEETIVCEEKHEQAEQFR
ncbi:hypothetical protein OIU76_017017 [Salix suchowensis]|nr:hypothetical protein OIU76_017017 [Salix suchowensis]